MSQSTYEAYFQALKNLPCWSVITGAGVGSMIRLNFGKKVLRERALGNPYLER